MLTVARSSPDGSVYRVSAIPSAAACAFIAATNVAGSPASHRASSRAMLSAEGSSRASRACRSVSTSPAATRTRDWRPAASAAYAAASCAETVSAGPSSAGRSGWSRSTRYAVITLATLAMGTGRTAPEEPRLPSPATSTVAWLETRRPSTNSTVSPSRSM